MNHFIKAIVGLAKASFAETIKCALLIHRYINFSLTLVSCETIEIG